MNTIMKTKGIMHFCMVVLMTSILFSCNGCEDDANGPEITDYSYEDTQYRKKVNKINIILPHREQV